MELLQGGLGINPDGGLSLLATYMAEILGDLFPDVENGSVRTVGQLKRVMTESMVRSRDRADEGRKCAECGVLPEESNRCSRCKAVVYCSRDCQRGHWKAHKKLCQPPKDSSDMGLWSLRRSEPPTPDHGLAIRFAHSPDSVDANLLIVVHGNGDNEGNFLRFTQKLRIPVTAILSVRAPHAASMQGHFWYPELDNVALTRDERRRVAPVWEAAELLVAQIRLAQKHGWLPHRIFLLGHGHGGVVAVEAARRSEATLGGVVASGDAVLEEVILGDPIPTRLVKHAQDLSIGESFEFLELRLQFCKSEQSENEEKWAYELIATEKAPTSASKDVVKRFKVTFKRSDFGNTQARTQVANFFDEKYNVRFGDFEEQKCRVTIEAHVLSMEELGSKSGTPVLVTTGERDTRFSANSAERQIQYVRRKFRIVESRRYKSRKDVMGTDEDELRDIYGFLLLCSVNKPRLEPSVVHYLGREPERVQVVPRSQAVPKKK